MGWVAILTPWWGSGKPILMVLRGACKEKTQMSSWWLDLGGRQGAHAGL